MARPISAGTKTTPLLFVVFDSLAPAPSLATSHRHGVHRVVLRLSGTSFVDIPIEGRSGGAPIPDLLELIPVPGSAVVLTGEAFNDIARIGKHQALSVIPLDNLECPLPLPNGTDG